VIAFVRFSIYLCLLAASCVPANCECDYGAVAKLAQSLNATDIAELTKDAKNGNAAAQYMLGTALSRGQPIPQNESAGAYWIEQAAKSGYASAEFLLGALYEKGMGVKEDRNQAFVWYRKAAEGGDCRGQDVIGHDYLDRKEPDYEKALEWLQRSAEQGFRQAQTDLGSLYENGDGVPRNDQLAAQWYQKAQERCQTTLPPDPPFTPPFPYQQNLSKGSFWYGTEKLWTGLHVAGTWGGLQNNKGYREKVFWFRQGYDARTEPKPALTVTGRRLDGDTATFTVLDATNAYSPGSWSAMLTAFEIPTAGCWELRGDYHGDSLSFIVWVEP